MPRVRPPEKPRPPRSDEEIGAASIHAEAAERRRAAKTILVIRRIIVGTMLTLATMGAGFLALIIIGLTLKLYHWAWTF